MWPIYATTGDVNLEGGLVDCDGELVSIRHDRYAPKDRIYITASVPSLGGLMPSLPWHINLKRVVKL